MNSFQIPCRREAALPCKRGSAFPYLVLCAWFVLAGTVMPLLAQNYSVDWFTIDGGGGTSTGGAYSVSGTIGQPDAGQMSGGPYALAGGFWSLINVIQTPGAPFLSAVQANGTVTISWPLPATGFVLDETPGLAASPSTILWTPTSRPYQTNATHIFITVPTPAGATFYRLRR